ncbi:MAG: hypothetical protein ACI9K2_002853 [Myxococcota bacterium]
MAETNNPPGVFAALAGGFRLAANSMGPGLAVAILFGLGSAGGFHLALRSIDAIKGMDPATSTLISQGLTGLALFLGVYLVVQFGKRWSGATTSSASWLPTLLFMPVALAAGSVAILRVAAQDYGMAAIMFAGMCFHLLYQTFAGAAAAVMWVRAADAAERGEPVGFGELVDGCRRTFLRVAVPHGARIQAVAIGMQVLIPGIFYALQYAFVDMVAVLDPERERVLERSGKLTWPLRQLLFRVLFVWLLMFELVIWGVTVPIDGMEVVAKAFIDPRLLSFPALVCQEVAYAISLWLLTSTMLFLYNWRMAQVRRRAAERQAAGQA